MLSPECTSERCWSHLGRPRGMQLRCLKGAGIQRCSRHGRYNIGGKLTQTSASGTRHHLSGRKKSRTWESDGVDVMIDVSHPYKRNRYHTGDKPLMLYLASNTHAKQQQQKK